MSTQKEDRGEGVMTTEVSEIYARDILNGIATGGWDDYIVDLIAACTERRKAQGSDKYFKLQVGDRVEIVGAPTGAKYLNGLKGTISRKLYVKIEVKMDPNQELGRFSELIIIPANLLKPISDD